jgi:tRNA(Leu) C34 or U34 (ribose-2'-O)-methylase TrmL
MAGTAESLNLAVAAGVLLYEVRRRTGLAAPSSRPSRPHRVRP